jgi:hypothetical protein
MQSSSFAVGRAGHHGCSTAASSKPFAGAGGKWTFRVLSLLGNVQPGKLPRQATYQTDPVARSAQLSENNNLFPSRKEIPRSGNTLTRAPGNLHYHGLRACEVVADVSEMRRDRQSTFIT